jgi:HTH-type transcriptional regulator, glycine betaine synthesis regulator
MVDSPANEGALLFSEAMSRLFERFGLRAVLGKVWTALYLEDRALDGRELRAKVGISTGALSTSLNELIDLGFVHRVAVPGERRFFYRAESEMWPLITRLIRDRERARLVEIIEVMRAAEERFGGTGDDASPARDGGRASPDGQSAEKVRHLIGIGQFVLDLLDAVTERTKVEMLAAQKWLEMSSKLGGEPLTRLRKRINAVKLGRKR